MNYSSTMNEIWKLTFDANSLFQSGDRIGLRGELRSPDDVIVFPVITTISKGVKFRLNNVTRQTLIDGLKTNFHYNDATIQLYLTKNSKGTTVLRSKTNGELRDRGLDGHGGSQLKHSDGCWIIGLTANSKGLVPISNVCQKLTRLGICDKNSILKITTEYGGLNEMA